MRIPKGEFAMATGTVKWFNETKGYGFIAPDEGGKDVFVHISAPERSGLRGLAQRRSVEPWPPRSVLPSSATCPPVASPRA